MSIRNETTYSVQLSSHNIHTILLFASTHYKENGRLYYSQRAFMRYLLQFADQESRTVLNEHFPEFLQEIAN